MEERERRQKGRTAEASLIEFVRQGWRSIEGDPYVDNWHLRVITEYLEAVSDGEIRRLIINIPPRHMKSLACAVFWPAWDWLRNPTRRWMFASYAQSLSVRDSVRCRRLIESPWYQGYWGKRFSLSGDQNTKIRFDNSAGGYRLATSVDGTGTGEGGDIICIDDPHNVRETESELVRQGVLDWWDQVMPTRLNNPKTGAFVVVMQRAHENDLTGHIIARELGWTHICIPARYEKDHPSRFEFDPRRVDGELLWPERVGEKEIAELSTKLGSYGVAGQLQQRPAPRGGGILKRSWWKKWEKAEPPECTHVMLSFDGAYSAKSDADYSAVTVWGFFRQDIHGDADLQRNADGLILLDAWHDRVEYPEMRRKVASLIKLHSPDTILVEKAASGQSLIQEFRRAGIAVAEYRADRDKVARAHSASNILESGAVWVPVVGRVNGGDNREMMPFAQMVVDECSTFPSGAHDDLVDTTVQALLRFRQSGMLRLGSDEWAEPEVKTPRSPNYSPYA